MIQKNSRVEFANGIRFYEQDLLYDDYIYSGSSTISVTLDYKNPGFGIALISSTGSTLNNNNAVLLFRIRNKTLEVIYKENDLQTILATYNATKAKTITENLKFTIVKDVNSYNISIGTQKLATFKCPYDMDYYYIGYYSNQDNVIKHINIASAVPYGWIINMNNTNGGYIDFYRDSIELKYCNGIAEIEQINIPLKKGKYYLKYETIDSDVLSYVMEYNDERLSDEEKNLLNSDKSFELHSDSKVSLKFKGTKGTIKNITITSSKYNDYIRTSPDNEHLKSIDTSYIKMYMDQIYSFIFKGTITHVPGSDHIDPVDYSIIKVGSKSYGLYDLNLATNITYTFTYRYGELVISNENGRYVTSVYIDDISSITLFENVNGKLKDFVIINTEGESINITIENTIKRSLPGVIKSPIIVVNNDTGEPLDLSGSYRWYYKNDIKYYYFTNTEREYFMPNYRLKMASPILDKSNTVTVYGIKHDSRFVLDELLHINNEGLDTINNCADMYDILFENDLHDIDKSTGEIKLTDIDDYKYIIVDYIKDNSYSINYRYNSNSYEIDIAVKNEADISMYYDNITQSISNEFVKEYISSKRYFNTGLKPNMNCYITIGGDKIS